MSNEQEVKLASKWYDTPGRKYHTLDHALAVVGVCDWLENQCGDGKNATVLRLAALYHDAVYIQGFTANEAASAKAFHLDVKALRLAGTSITDKEVEAVETLIRGTVIEEHLTSCRIDGVRAILMDADLASLGEPYEVFVQNQSNILEEAGYDNSQRHLSAEFLMKFLVCRSHIFHTHACRISLEWRARENIERFASEFHAGVELS